MAERKEPAVATLMVLVALAALVAAIVYVVRKDWRLAGICGVVFVLALIINSDARNAKAQQAAQGTASVIV